MMWLCIVVWALLLAVTNGPPADEPTEVTACPLTTAVLALKMTDPSETCSWLKDTNVLFDNRNTAYSFKRNGSHENLIILFASEKDSGTYECQIRLSNGSYKHGSTYRFKLHVRSQEECNTIQDNTQQDNTRQDNNSSNNCYGTNVADILAALFSFLAALFGAFLIFSLKFYLNLWKKISAMILNEECAPLIKTTPSHEVTTPIQVSDGNENAIGVIESR